MTLFPSVQERARAELDAVVGQDRLPTFADRERLPYINAVTLEALRWHTVVPTGAFHPDFASSRDMNSDTPMILCLVLNRNLL